jgi:phospholipid/cholesterol/gamma-HCH transport system permease protein
MSADREHLHPPPVSGAWARADDGGWLLRLPADARCATGRLPRAPAEPGTGASLCVDGADVTSWDAALAAELWDLARRWRVAGSPVRWRSLPDGLAAVLALAQADAPAAGPTVTGAADSASAPAFASPATAVRSQAMVTVAFFGEVLLALARALRGASALRAADVLRQLDQAGPRSLPIVLLTCALVGLMLAYMGGAQLDRIGAQGFLANVVTVGMVRELAGLMAGVILAGRVGAAFAAELGTMQAGEEIDALRVLGVDPVEYLVLPRLLALLLMAPALVAFGALAGIVAGWPAAVLAYGITHAEYLHQSLRSLTFTHLWIGMLKGVLYMALVAIAGCREGLHAGRSAAAVGAATRAAVVRALVWIVAAACGTTVVLTSLGY